jgi:hypothetical protein
MGMKGDIQPDHILTNRATLNVGGIFTFVPSETGELSDEIKMVDLPDDTRATGGRKKATEMTFKIPSHHTVDMLAVEAWRIAGVGIVLPGYKRMVVLTIESATGGNKLVRILFGCWISKRVDPATQMGGDGNMAETEFTMQIDEVSVA